MIFNDFNSQIQIYLKRHEFFMKIHNIIFPQVTVTTK